MNIIAIIPSRFQSSRFPGKPLALILGKPMIQHVYERVKQIKQIKEVIVATDDLRIHNKVLSFGGNSIMTGINNSGTNRVYEAYIKHNKEYDLIVNVQGDEPLIKHEMIIDLIESFEKNKNIDFATLKHKILNEIDISNPNIAKVVVDLNNFAIYFSRSKIPYNRDSINNINYFKHIGIYAYKPNALKKFCSLPPSILETSEQLEQLRHIENRFKIFVKETQFDSIGVDRPEDVEKVENLIKSNFNEKK
jgi:3-deoxy-manno-octulosonate cytidylyltransferase (CMP-KDO synthetase)